MRKKRKIVLWILLALAIIIIGMVSWAAVDPIRYRNLAANNVDLENLPDGVYKGSFKGGRFSNSVEVTVQDHRILDIKKIKPSGKTEKLYRQIYDKVIEEQSLAIDAVSSASVTTNTALKAIENALSGQLE